MATGIETPVATAVTVWVGVDIIALVLVVNDAAGIVHVIVSVPGMSYVANAGRVMVATVSPTLKTRSVLSRAVFINEFQFVPLAAISESEPPAMPSSLDVPVTKVSPVKVIIMVLPPVTISASVCVGTAVPVMRAVTPSSDT